jgi:hypothetical protein
MFPGNFVPGAPSLAQGIITFIPPCYSKSTGFFLIGMEKIKNRLKGVLYLLMTDAICSS